MILGLATAERVALITGVFVAVAAAIPAIIAAVVTARTRAENREQHAEGQAKVERLAAVVEEQTGAIHKVGHDVARVTEVVTDHLKWHAAPQDPNPQEGTQ